MSLETCQLYPVQALYTPLLEILSEPDTFMDIMTQEAFYEEPNQHLSLADSYTMIIF